MYGPQIHESPNSDKSQALQLTKKTCPTGVADMITHITDRAFNVDRNLDDMLLIHEECKNKVLGHSSGSDAKSNNGGIDSDIYGPRIHTSPDISSKSSSSSTDSDDGEPIRILVVTKRNSSSSSSSTSFSSSSSSSDDSGDDDDDDGDDDDDSDEYEHPGYTQFDLMETDYLYCMYMIKGAEEWRIKETVSKLEDIYDNLAFTGELANYGLYEFDEMPPREAFTDDVKKITIANYHAELLKKLKPFGATKEDSMMLFDLLNY